MQDNTLVILALVGLAVVCLGLFVVLFVTVFRFTGRNFMGFLSLLVRDSKDEGNGQPSTIKPPKPDLRSIAEAQDFDSALARHVVQDEIEPQAARRLIDPPNEAQSDRPFPDATPRLGARKTPRPADRSRDSNDEMFADLLDFGDEL